MEEALSTATAIYNGLFSCTPRAGITVSAAPGCHTTCSCSLQLPESARIMGNIAMRETKIKYGGGVSFHPERTYLVIPRMRSVNNFTVKMP